MIVDPLWWCGLVVAVFFGWAFSSYASNFIYRLPRGDYPFGKPPYCDECSTLLQPKDLFPIFSWLLTGGKCRYCGSGVPACYFWLEIFGTASFVYLYTHYGFGDVFLVMAAAFFLLSTQAMMAYQDAYISRGVTVALAITGLVLRLLEHASLGDVFFDGLLASMMAIAVYIWKTPEEERSKDMRKLPHYIWLLAVAGIWVPFPYSFGFAVVWGIVLMAIAMMWKQPKWLRYGASSHAVLLLAAIAWYHSG